MTESFYPTASELLTLAAGHHRLMSLNHAPDIHLSQLISPHYPPAWTCDPPLVGESLYPLSPGRNHSPDSHQGQVVDRATIMRHLHKAEKPDDPFSRTPLRYAKRAPYHP
jgi:hypothetical protein